MSGATMWNNLRCGEYLMKWKTSVICDTITASFKYSAISYTTISLYLQQP
jgi:hypothetical protein